MCNSNAIHPGPKATLICLARNGPVHHRSQMSNRGQSTALYLPVGNPQRFTGLVVYRGPSDTVAQKSRLQRKRHGSRSLTGIRKRHRVRSSVIEQSRFGVAIGALCLWPLERRAIKFELAYWNLSFIHKAHADRALVDLPVVEHNRAGNACLRRLDRTHHEAKNEEDRRQISVYTPGKSHRASCLSPRS